ncbi:MAG: FAD binding domain-containing protein [Betaproteobacteria bacterium]|nr:FAD binding domain-containing protein [Betaproteobacteria bacterium]
MEAFEWQQAASPENAASLATHTTTEAMLSAQGTRAAFTQAMLIKAGGVDLIGLMKDGLVSPVRLIDINHLPELQGISENAGGGFTIGALTTLAQIATHAGLMKHYPAFVQAVTTAASPQIRNRATLAGNLLQRPRCWYLRSAAHHCLRKGGEHCFAYAGDNRYHAILANHDGCAIVHPSTPATALLALQAQIESVSANGVQRVISIDDFFVLPSIDLHHENVLRTGELITAINLPAPHHTHRSAYLQLGEKTAFDWPLAAVAVFFAIDDKGICQQTRIVLGGAAPTPWRAREAERIIEGSKIDQNNARSAAEAAIAVATPLSGNAYKLPLLCTLINRTIMKAATSE